MAAGVVIAEREIDGNSWQCLAQASDDVARGLFDEAKELGVRGVGKEDVISAVELMADDVAGEDGKPDLRTRREGLSVNGVHGGLEEAIVGIDQRLDRTPAIDGGVVCCSGGRGWGSEDGGPLT